MYVCEDFAAKTHLFILPVEADDALSATVSLQFADSLAVSVANRDASRG